MNFDPTWIFLSLFPSGIGFVLLAYGKKEGRWPQIVTGLIFLVYPYFTDSVAALIGVGVALGVGLWLGLRSGW